MSLSRADLPTLHNMLIPDLTRPIYPPFSQQNHENEMRG